MREERAGPHVTRARTRARKDGRYRWSRSYDSSSARRIPRYAAWALLPQTIREFETKKRDANEYLVPVRRSVGHRYEPSGAGRSSCRVRLWMTARIKVGPIVTSAERDRAEQRKLFTIALKVLDTSTSVHRECLWLATRPVLRRRRTESDAAARETRDAAQRCGSSCGGSSQTKCPSGDSAADPSAETPRRAAACTKWLARRDDNQDNKRGD